MLKHHILISYRNLVRNKLFSTINILGLALGLACALLILLWVNDELKTNRFHEKNDRLFQVISEVEFTNGKVEYGHTVASPLAEALKAKIPEIEDVIRMDWGSRNLLLVEGNGIQELGLHADASFFKVFSFELKQGNPATVLEDMYSIVISQNLADKFFPNSPNLLGKIINVRNWDGDTPFKVTGVFDKVPVHSSLKFDYVLPYNF
ncbi:ABC transporter permease [Flammeovirgaceae bacterium SG7u.111]|nr:ABC transporter permease [Flammeovirgaceae bacterium SG7u.132]WPO34014.1 ABC transporter permease [Flammeovirgaceae bacterium SG7u.111]